jgi:hypothetical protein
VTSQPILTEEELLERGVHALLQELGPVEAARFLVKMRGPSQRDSVQIHREWQDSLDAEAFLRQVLGARPDTAK